MSTASAPSGGSESAGGPAAGAPSPVARSLGRVQRSRPYRAYERLGHARGTFLAAGIAFYGVFSLFPLLALGFTVLGVVVGRDSGLQADLVAYLGRVLPVDGLFTSDGGEAPLVDPDELVVTLTDGGTLAVSAIVGAVALVLTGLGWISALREGIRGVFRLPTIGLDPVRSKLLDLGVLLTLGAVVVASALSSVAANTVTTQLLELVGLERTVLASVLARGSVLVVVAALDTVLFMLQFRVLAGVGIRLRRLVGGAVVAAVLVGILKLSAGLLLGSAGGSSALATIAVLPALLVWLNLTARVTLYGAAWAAVGPRPGEEAWPQVDDVFDGVTGPVGRPAADRPRDVEVGAGDGSSLPRPRPGQAPSPSPRAAPALPARWSDRAVLGSGVVLGVTAAVAGRVAVGAARTAGAAVAGLVRGRGRDPV